MPRWFSVTYLRSLLYELRNKTNNKKKSEKLNISTDFSKFDAKLKFKKILLVYFEPKVTQKAE